MKNGSANAANPVIGFLASLCIVMFATMIGTAAETMHEDGVKWFLYGILIASTFFFILEVASLTTKTKGAGSTLAYAFAFNTLFFPLLFCYYLDTNGYYLGTNGGLNFCIFYLIGVITAIICQLLLAGLVYFLVKKICRTKK